MMLRYCVASFVLVAATVPLFCIETDLEWHKAEQRAANAVVQILVQGTEFNFLEPYMSPQQKRGKGSGFFIDTDGHILTNYHVVSGAKSVYINVPAVGQFPLKVSIIGVDGSLDVALLKLSAESREMVIQACGSINALEFGDSDKLHSTQPVLAQGFPKGVGGSVKSTAGNSAGHDFLDDHSYIFITAPISPGNSGGPVLDREGKVMGIATMHRLNAQNYNYMVPSNEILVILKDLYTTHFIRRPEIGLRLNRVTEAHARSLANPLPAGVYVKQVIENSVEERAGLKVGDMIYAVNVGGTAYKIDEFGEVKVAWRKGQKISLQELLVRSRIGDSIKYSIYRKGSKMEIICAFEHPILRPVREIYPEYEPQEIDYEMLAGIVIQPLRLNHIYILQSFQNPLRGEVAKFVHPENQTKPVLLISWVLPGSQGALTDCLAPGLILDKINGITVTTLKELREALKLSTETNMISIETKDKFTTVLDLSKVLEDEERLSHDFIFAISDTVRWLMKANSYKNLL